MGFKFPRHNHQGITIKRSFFKLIKVQQGLHEDDVIAEQMIPTT
jgi:hypothetical protein